MEKKKYRTDNYNDHDVHVASWGGKSVDGQEEGEELIQKLNLVGARTDLETLIPILEKENNLNMTEVNEQIDDAIIGSIFSAQESIWPSYARLMINAREFKRRDFELVGYDIVLDQNGRPIIAEVNLAPDVRSDTPILTEEISRMLQSLFDIVDIESKYIEETKRKVNDKWNSQLLTRIPRAENYGLKFNLQEIQNKGELFSFYLDEGELKRSKNTKWKRLCPLNSTLVKKYLFLSRNVNDHIFAEWYKQGVKTDDLPTPQNAYSRIQNKHLLQKDNKK